MKQKIIEAALRVAETKQAYQDAEAVLEQLLEQLGTRSAPPVPKAPRVTVDAPPSAMKRRRASPNGGESIASRVIALITESPTRAFTVNELRAELGNVPSAVLSKLVKEGSLAHVGRGQYRAAGTEQADAVPVRDRVTPERKQVLAALTGGPLLVNEICDKTGLSFGRVMSALDGLFDTDRVARTADEKWRLA